MLKTLAVAAGALLCRAALAGEPAAPRPAPGLKPPPTAASPTRPRSNANGICIEDCGRLVDRSQTVQRAERAGPGATPAPRVAPPARAAPPGMGPPPSMPPPRPPGG